MTRFFASILIGTALMTALAIGPVAAQEPAQPVKITDPDGRPLIREPGISVVPQLPDLPPADVGGFGGFEEAPEGTHQPGNAAMRYLRRGAESLRDALRRFEQAVVEGNGMAAAQARAECRLLIETMRENNPADILTDELAVLDGILADPRQDDPGAALARLRNAAMNFHYLYPSFDLEREVGSLETLTRDHRIDVARAATTSLREQVALGPAAAASATLERHFAEAQRLLDAGRRDDALREIRAARESAATVHAAGFLGEAIWYLGRMADALGQGLPEIARISAGNAGAFLDAAAQESPALREQLVAPRVDTARFAKDIAGGAVVARADVVTEAERVQALAPGR